eukprot:Lithocolla_globosa_v1_NODE_620_length_3581_cov_10.242484.p2 type:complete len:109 gc:universal NODE_620_length_3581_cov_10.242484:2862-3188(+)
MSSKAKVSVRLFRVCRRSCGATSCDKLLGGAVELLYLLIKRLSQLNRAVVWYVLLNQCLKSVHLVHSRVTDKHVVFASAALNGVENGVSARQNTIHKPTPLLPLVRPI